MKKTIAFSGLLLALAQLASATTTVNFNNFNFPATPENGITFVDNSGTPLSGLNFGIGTFDGAVGSDAAAVRAGFTELGTGTTQAIHFAAANTAGSAATDLSPQDNTPVYVVFYGNEADGTGAADLASATEFIVFEGNANFIVENPALGAGFDLDLQKSTIVYGDTSVMSNGTGVNAPFTGFTNTVTFGAGDGAIPEPSSALLSLVGLAFVARRRR
ncbi:MAG: PEP-CTERM sorting domain-containing protein [Akkermansiaceae bacterium]